MTVHNTLRKVANEIKTAFDKWSAGHFMLGVFLGFSMRSHVFAIAFIVAWECYEKLFRKDVKESTSNVIADISLGIIGVLFGVWLWLKLQGVH